MKKQTRPKNQYRTQLMAKLTMCGVAYDIDLVGVEELPSLRELYRSAHMER
jgi:hypothetical protein